MNSVVVSRSSIIVLRVMLSGIFLVAGLNHVIVPEGVAKRLIASSMYGFFPTFVDPQVLVIAVGLGLLIGGLLLIFNQFTRPAAILLFVLLVPITVSVQLQGLETIGPLFKNVAIAGALLFFIFNQFDKNREINYDEKN